MISLPQDFIKELQEILGEDLEYYIQHFQEKAYRGISVNRLKITPERVKELLGFRIEKSPFYRDGFYMTEEMESIGNMPLHCGGAFYVQEPSAASAAELLEIKGGEKVLDLCAAPGGKSAQIASMLNHTGLLWSNEIVPNRARILLSNFERMGIDNGVISCCHPDILCQKLTHFFDRVLVDAPCSGEGMFRKNPEAITEWSREHVLSCAERQFSILQSAAKALKKDGILVYSTCTFSKEENEENVKRFLKEFPDFEPYDIEENHGRKTELKNALRITPKEGGEGHFAARFRKISGENPQIVRHSEKNRPDQIKEKLLEEMLRDILKEVPQNRRVIKNDKAYLLPDDLPETDGLNILRAGVLAGVFKKSRIEPEHALFMGAKPENLKRVLNLTHDDSRVIEFLKGHEIDCPQEKGYTAVCVDGIIIGFGKCSDQKLKNKYPSGLRQK